MRYPCGISELNLRIIFQAHFELSLLDVYEQIIAICMAQVKKLVPGNRVILRRPGISSFGHPFWEQASTNLAVSFS
jgi:hypothetical protein